MLPETLLATQSSKPRQHVGGNPGPGPRPRRQNHQTLSGGDRKWRKVGETVMTSRQGYLVRSNVPDSQPERNIGCIPSIHACYACIDTQFEFANITARRKALFQFTESRRIRKMRLLVFSRILDCVASRLWVLAYPTMLCVLLLQTLLTGHLYYLTTRILCNLKSSPHCVGSPNKNIFYLQI